MSLSVPAGETRQKYRRTSPVGMNITGTPLRQIYTARLHTQYLYTTYRLMFKISL